MKTAQDPRHQKRIDLMQTLFRYSFSSEQDNTKIADILVQLPTIDKTIQACAPEWPLPKIAQIDLAILRLSVYEIVYSKETPQKVVIDEAVELAKAYGNPNSAKFINGVLGTVITKE